jgi:acetyl esterase/lipase
VHAVLRQVVRRDRFDTAAAQVTSQRQNPAPHAPTTGRAARGVNVSEETVAGVRTYRLTPARPSGRTVVYLHGGAYIGEISGFHWTFVLDLVRRTHVECLVPVYVLAPDATAERTVADAAAVIGLALEQAGTGDVVVMGDSAGAGLALAAVQALRDGDENLPAAMILLSPWLDVAMTHPDQAAIEGYDLMLRRDYLAEAGLLWAGALPTSDRRVSPLHGDLTGLPPLHVFTGTHDILVPDSRTLSERVRAAGGPITYVEAPGMQHVYAIMPLLAQARRARRQIRELLCH